MKLISFIVLLLSLFSLSNVGAVHEQNLQSSTLAAGDMKKDLPSPKNEGEAEKNVEVASQQNDVKHEEVTKIEDHSTSSPQPVIEKINEVSTENNQKQDLPENASVNENAEGLLKGYQNATEKNGVADIPMCTKYHLSDVKGFLLDVEGTICSHEGLAPGTDQFFDWLNKQEAGYVLLSDGIRGKKGLAKKLSESPFKLNFEVSTDRIHTAGVAVSQFMKDQAPVKSNIYLIGTTLRYPDASVDSIRGIMKTEVPSELFESWAVRSDLTMDEIQQWATDALKGHPTFVVLATHGEPNDSAGEDPVTNNPGYLTFDFNLMKKINTLLRNGASFIVAATDSAEAVPKSKKYPDVDTSWPTIGGFESLFLTSSEMFPHTQREKDHHFNTGKAGNMGVKYMVAPAMEALLKQNPKVTSNNTVVIGDNLGTDIYMGRQAGLRSIFVRSGVHNLQNVQNWSVTPTCYVDNLGDIPKIVSG